MNAVFQVQAVMSLVDHISGPLRAIKAGMAGAEAGALSLSAKLGRLAKAMLPVVALAGGVLLGLAGPLAAAADFQQAMSEVGAISNATAAELKILEKSALDLGAATSYSASQVAMGQKYLAMAGFNTAQIAAAMPGMLDLAAAGTMDLARASDIASDILTQFGLEAKQMGVVADVLSKTFTTSNTNLELLAETMKYVGPVARSAGASIQETAAMAGFMANMGLKGSMAGTALRSMFLKLQGPTGESAKEIARLGLTTKDASGNLLPMFDILQQLEKATGRMGSADRDAALKKMFGEEAVTGVMALLAQGTDKLRAYAKALESSTGTAAKVAARQLSNLKGAVTILGSAWEGLQITIGSVFLPVLTSLVGLAAKAATWLNALAKTPVGQALIYFAGAAAVAVIASTALAAAGAMLPYVISGITAALAPLGAALAAISWPIWIAIGAAGLLYLAWKSNFGGLHGLVARWWTKISLTVRGVMAVIGSLKGGLGSIRGELAKDIKAQGLLGLVTTISRVVFRLMNFFGGLISVFRLTWSFIVTTLEPAFTVLIDALRPLGTAAGYLGTALGGAAAATQAGAWTQWGQILGWLTSGVLMPLADIIASVIFLFVALGKDIGTIAAVVYTAGENIVLAVSAMWTQIKTFFQTFDLAEFGMKLLDTFVTGIQARAGSVYDAVRSALGPVGRLLPHSDAQEGPLSSLKSSGMSLIGTMAEGVTVNRGALKAAAAGAFAGLALALPAPGLPDFQPGPIPSPSAVTLAQDSPRAAQAEGRKVVIQSLTVNLDQVKDGASFAEELQRFVEQFDA